jgi:hypothetical protein
MKALREIVLTLWAGTIAAIVLYGTIIICIAIGG